MMPDGIDAVVWKHQLAGRIDRRQGRDEIERALDDVESLIDTPEPKLQEPASQPVGVLRRRLEQATP